MRSLTDHVQDALAGFGITRQALWSVLVVTGGRLDLHADNVHVVGEDDLAVWVSSLGPRLEKSEIDAIAEVLGRHFPTYDAPNPLARRVAPAVAPVARPGVLAMPRGRGNGAALAAALHRAAVTPALCRWMTFLTPEQVALVRTSWEGPGLIQGAAGSGKTVVGLHRAAYLAERHSAPILYVTPTDATAAVLSGYLGRLAPQVRDSVVFTTLLDLAGAIVEQSGARAQLDTRQASIVFMAAWMARGRGGPLCQVDERPAYWQQEVDHVLKARGVLDLEEYCALDRTDRHTTLDRPQREAMWSLYLEYQRRLAKARLLDAHDVVALAGDLVRRGVVRPTYGAVIVDGAEDLPLVGLQLTSAIAGDGADRLLLLQDGQQTLHPGVGLGTAVGVEQPEPLTLDHRCSADVLRVAAALVAGDGHADLDAAGLAHPMGVAVRRRGPVPTTVRTTTREQLDSLLVERLVELGENGDWAWGDTAVLVDTAADLEHVRAVLMRAALPVVDIQGHPHAGRCLVLATYEQARGLEFERVLLPGLTKVPARRPGEQDAAFHERTERLHRRQYVAVTRARHELWLGYLDE